MCDRLPRKCDVQTSYKPSNYVLGLIFPRATYSYHTIVPSTDELYCLNSTFQLALFVFQKCFAKSNLIFLFFIMKVDVIKTENVLYLSRHIVIDKKTLITVSLIAMKKSSCVKRR